MNTFFKSQFSFYLTVSMRYSRAKNSKINRLRKRRLRIIYWDKQSSFEILLKIKDSTCKALKYRTPYVPLIVIELFEQKNEQHYYLRNNAQFTVPPIRTVYHGSKIIPRT